MRATICWLGALLLACAAVPTVRADPWPACPCLPQAPDTCGPGFYCTHPCGMVYGPNYCLRPPWEPFSGFVPGVHRVPGPGDPGYTGMPGGKGGTPLFPTHPYAHSPRDYFMVMD